MRNKGLSVALTSTKMVSLRLLGILKIYLQYITVHLINILDKNLLFIQSRKWKYCKWISIEPYQSVSMNAVVAKKTVFEYFKVF